MVVQLAGASDSAASFQIENEDHTLGNALRYIIMKKLVFLTNSSARVLTCISSPEVEFCGYTIPHPSEPKMNIRIQTYGNIARCTHDPDVTPLSSIRNTVITNRLC